jgi:hypothetical protein
MLRIQRSANDNVIFTLSGRIEAEHLQELRRVCSLETADRLLVLDLKEVTLVDRDAVKYLARCQANGVQLENCPAYIREWIDRESGQTLPHISRNSRHPHFRHVPPLKGPQRTPHRFSRTSRIREETANRQRARSSIFKCLPSGARLSLITGASRLKSKPPKSERSKPAWTEC